MSDFPKSDYCDECGHWRGMHSFGFSENIWCAGYCMLCPCRKFAESSETTSGDASTGDKRVDPVGDGQHVPS